METETGSKKNIAFIVELFMLLCILLLVIVVITETLVTTRARSCRARQLTEAVIAAENVMEVINSSGEEDGLAGAASALGGMEDIGNIKLEDDKLYFPMVMSGGGSGRAYMISCRETEEKGGSGSLRSFEVSVTPVGGSEPVYTLRSGKYDRGGRS